MSSAFGSISNSLVRGATSTSPNSPPPGVNQTIHKGRFDSDANYRSYQNALERERNRKLGCKSILSC